MCSFCARTAGLQTPAHSVPDGAIPNLLQDKVGALIASRSAARAKVEAYLTVLYELMPFFRIKDFTTVPVANN